MEITEPEWSYIYHLVCIELEKHPKNKMIDNILNKIRDTKILK